MRSPTNVLVLALTERALPRCLPVRVRVANTPAAPASLTRDARTAGGTEETPVRFATRAVTITSAGNCRTLA